MGTESHKCRCSENHCRPEMEEPGACEVLVGTPHIICTLHISLCGFIMSGMRNPIYQMPHKEMTDILEK